MPSPKEGVFAKSDVIKKIIAVVFSYAWLQKFYQSVFKIQKMKKEQVVKKKISLKGQTYLGKH